MTAGHRGPLPVLPLELALAAGRHMFLRDGTVGMEALAKQLSVGRATLYRVVGTRDKLLGEVISTLASRTLEAAVADASGAGVDRIIQIARRFNEQVVAFQPLRTFLENEPLTAMRVLFTPAGNVHRRSREQWTTVIAKIVETDGVNLPYDTDDFVYVFVRVGESMLFADLLAGRMPDIDLAETVQRSLFGSYSKTPA